MLKKAMILISCLVLGSSIFAQDDEFNTERLPLGNPDTKYSFCAVQLEKIYDTNANESISREHLVDRLKNYSIILIGESHTNEHHHQVQLEIMKGLVTSGYPVCLALEMFTPAQNEALYNYTSGLITEEEFIDQSNYFETWSHNYRYYKPIFDYARENEIKMYGINIDRDYASKIGRGGLQSLSPEDQKLIPEVDTTDIEHRFYVKVAMQGMDATAPAQFKNIYAAQSLWDAVMGEGAIKVARENPQAKVIVLAGSGHVAYNFSIGKIIKKRSTLSFASVIAVDIPDTVKESVMMKVKKNLKKDKKKTEEPSPEKKMPPMAMMGKAKDTTPYKIVIQSLADFLWGVPEESYEKYPSFGFSVKENDQQKFEIIRVIPESIAEKQGFQRGDIIRAIDDIEFATILELKKYLSTKDWDDTIVFHILRENEAIEIQFTITTEEDK